MNCLKISVLLAFCLLINANEFGLQTERPDEGSVGEPRIKNPSKFADLEEAFAFATNPSVLRARIALITILTVGGQIGYLATHFLLWDYQDTKNSERFSPVRLYNNLVNPDIALGRILDLIGRSAFQALFLALPTLLWTGQELEDDIPADAEGRLFASFGGNKDETELALSLRTILSPRQVAATVVISLMSYLATNSFRIFSSFFGTIEQAEGRKLPDGNMDKPYNSDFGPARRNCT